MKRYDSTEFMEAPCLCDCGTWFDLDEGSRDKNSNKVICKECGNRQDRIEKIEFEILYLEKLPNKKREIKRLQKRIEEIQNEPF